MGRLRRSPRSRISAPRATQAGQARRQASITRTEMLSSMHHRGIQAIATAAPDRPPQPTASSGQSKEVVLFHLVRAISGRWRHYSRVAVAACGRHSRSLPNAVGAVAARWTARDRLRLAEARRMMRCLASAVPWIANLVDAGRETAVGTTSRQWGHQGGRLCAGS